MIAFGPWRVVVVLFKPQRGLGLLGQHARLTRFAQLVRPEAQAAHLRVVRRRDNGFVHAAGMIAMAVRNVTPRAGPHGVDPDVERRYVERLFSERKHGEANVCSIFLCCTLRRPAAVLALIYDIGRASWHVFMTRSPTRSVTLRSSGSRGSTKVWAARFW